MKHKSVHLSGFYFEYQDTYLPVLQGRELAD